jgi:general stress protein CsbA
MLVGIGLMLVGAAAYALPDVHHWYALFPAFAGIAIGSAGFVARAQDGMRRSLMVLCAVVAIAVFVYTAVRVAPDSWAAKRTYNHSQLISDIDSLGLTAVYLFFAIRSFLLSREEEEKKKEKVAK